MAIRAGPTQGKNSIDFFAKRIDRPVTHGGQIGNETDIPKYRRNRKVRGHGKYVPEQGGTEIHPQWTHRIRVRKQPIASEPRTARVHERINQRANYSKNRHGLGGAVNARTPVLPEQIKDGGNQSARVTDT